MQLTQLNSVQPISAKQVSRVFVYLLISRVTVSVLSIVELKELCYLILSMLHEVWTKNQLSQFRCWLLACARPDGRSAVYHTHHTKIATGLLLLVLWGKILMIDLALLRPVYSDTTQLNSTSSWVELCRYKRALREYAADVERENIVFGWRT